MNFNGTFDRRVVINRVKAIVRNWPANVAIISIFTVRRDLYDILKTISFCADCISIRLKTLEGFIQVLCSGDCMNFSLSVLQLKTKYQTSCGAGRHRSVGIDRKRWQQNDW